VTLLAFTKFKQRFEEKVSSYNLDWRVFGFLTPSGRIYQIGTDTKVISTVFEALVAPLVKEIADEHGYLVEFSEQTVYPDFTLSPPDGEKARVAIDVKTTYRRFSTKGNIVPFRYTLGSYTSFLRSPGAKKNIKYPYIEYSDHWTIGFIYARIEGIAAKVYEYSGNLAGLTCPYGNVEFFVQEKYKIVGLTPASGNTTNIGSFPTNNILDLRDGIGPFAKHGKDVCDEYWRNYPRVSGDRKYSTVEEFLKWHKLR